MKLSSVIHTVSQFIIDPHHSSHSDLMKGVAWMTTLFTGYHTYGAIQGISALWLYSMGSKNETYEKMCGLFNQIFYPQTNPPHPPQPAKEKPYSLEVTLSQIEQARKEGKKIGINVGKSGDESVPKEEGWLWVTLDLQIRGNCTDPERPHLQINFNDEKAMKKLWRKFDKVIVDYSVTKFCDGSPWPPFIHLLTKNKESELIIEAIKDYTNTRRSSDSCFYNLGDGILHIPWDLPWDSVEVYQKCYDPYFYQLQLRLEKFFAYVELIESEFPHNERGWGKVFYFHLKGPLPVPHPTHVNEEIPEDNFERYITYLIRKELS